METTYMSIRKLSKVVGLSEEYLRQELKKNRLPGRYVGSHFKVNVPLLIEALNEADKQAVESSVQPGVDMSE